MRRVRWGVLGCSRFARRRSISAMLQTPCVDLVGVASRTAERAREFRELFGLSRSYGSYDDMLEDPAIEAVHITLPNSLHAEWALKALAKGKHVLCEKPFTTTVEDAARLHEMAISTRFRLMEAFVWRFHPQHLRARQAIREGAIGTVRLVRAAFSCPALEPGNIRLNASLGGGSIFDVGCYPVSGARFYFNGEPVAVHARGVIDADSRVDVRMAALLEFAGGHALIDCGFGLPFRADLEVLGESGRIYIPRAWQPPERATIYINDEMIEFPETNQYVSQFEIFSRSILDDVPLEFDSDDGLRQTRAIDLVIKDVRSNAASVRS